MKYINRYLDDELKKWMRVIGAVLIVGPKWCGKQLLLNNTQKVF